MDLIPQIRTQDATEAVWNDLRSYTRFAERMEFLDKFFPLQDIHENILASLKKSGTYNGRWSNLPAEPCRSKSGYYEPFRKICEDIAITYFKLENKTKDRCWLDRALTKQGSFTNAAENRPDIVEVLGPESEWNEHVEKLDKALEARMIGSKAKEVKEAQEKEDVPEPELPDDELADLIALWCRLATIIEIEPHIFINYLAAHETTLQLADYMRQIFREQNDRHFLFGLTLFHKDLAVWYCDRSGLLGIDEPIDIHEEPLLFIRVICHLSSMTPKQLGFEPSMKLFLSRDEQFFSHEVKLDELKELLRKSAPYYRLHWMMEIQDKKYVTIRGLSLSSPEIMCGRGQLVWAAVDVEERKLVVIKQAWSPFTIDEDDPVLRSEADVYAFTCTPEDHDEHFIAKVLGSEVVPGTRTLRDFRGGLKHTSTLQKKYVAAACEVYSEVSYTETIVRYESLFAAPRQFTERQLCRTVFRDFGYALKRFISRKELMTMLGDCLKGYEYLLGKGVLHRDLSTGNILICPKDLSGPVDTFQPDSTVGRLNDLDHAKVDEDYREGPRSKLTLPDDFEDKFARLETICRTCITVPGVCLDPEVTRTVIGLVHSCVKDDVDHYTQAILYLIYVVHSLKKEWQNIQKRVSQRDPSVVTLEDLLLYAVEDLDLPPDFSNVFSRNDERSGTIPFMSHKLLEVKLQRPHSAIHDMESLFWILVYLCLTRSGPGGNLRDEMITTSEQSSTPEAVRLQQLVDSTFNDPNTFAIALMKTMLLTDLDHFLTSVLDQIHPYFESLKPVLLSWWRILHQALILDHKHSYFGIDYIFPHIGFRRAITQFLENTNNTVEDEQEYRQKRTAEENRRRKDQKEFRSAIDWICGPLPGTKTAPLQHPVTPDVSENLSVRLHAELDMSPCLAHGHTEWLSTQTSSNASPPLKKQKVS